MQKTFCERKICFLLEKKNDLRKIFFFLDFYEFNCLGIFIANANTINWRYATAKASAFVERCF